MDCASQLKMLIATTWECVPICMCIYFYVFLFVCVSISMCLFVCVFVCVYLYVPICVCLFVCVHLYVSIRMCLFLYLCVLFVCVFICVSYLYVFEENNHSRLKASIPQGTFSLDYEWNNVPSIMRTIYGRPRMHICYIRSLDTSCTVVYHPSK